jgi:hypothetical protein
VDVDVVPQTADAQADCRRVAAIHAFVAVAWMKFPGAPCVADELRTVMIATGDRVANATLERTQGRLAVASSTDGVLPARVLDLVQSGRLDHKRVAVVATPGGEADAEHVRRLLATADPQRRISLVASAATPPNAPYDVVIATAFDPSLAALAHAGAHPVAAYFLGNGYDGALDGMRTTAGPAVAQSVAASGVYAWIGPDLAAYRSNDEPTMFATMCNRSLTARRGIAAAASSTTTTTLSRTLPDGPFQRVADVCLAWRVTARALYNAGPEPTQRSLVRALYRLPFVDNPVGGPNARPDQVITEPLARAGLPVYLAQAEYPCVHPTPPRIVTDARMCWVPAPGWEHGHAVNAPTEPTTPATSRPGP